MALAARQVQIAGGDDHVVRVQRDIIVDPQNGEALEVENITAAVDLGDGNIGVAQRQRVIGVKAVPAAQQSKPSYSYTANTEAPPPYYAQQPPPQQRALPPPQRQQANAHVVVVQPEPRVVHVHHSGGSSDYGMGALIFAVAATFCICFFGCWWSLICTFTAIVLASNATSAGARGDYSTARSNSNFSYGCTIAGIVTTVVGIAILFGIIFSNNLSSSSSSSSNSYYG